MLKQKITVVVHTTVGGPNGMKLMPGKVVELEDNGYTRLLLESGTVSLIDPPSLDPVFLEKGGYELQEGYSYDDLKTTSAAEEEPKKVGKKAIKVQKNVEPIPASESMDSEESLSSVDSEEGTTIEEDPK